MFSKEELILIHDNLSLNLFELKKIGINEEFKEFRLSKSICGKIEKEINWLKQKED